MSDWEGAYGRLSVEHRVVVAERDMLRETLDTLFAAHKETSTSAAAGPAKKSEGGVGQVAPGQALSAPPSPAAAPILTQPPKGGEETGAIDEGER